MADSNFTKNNTQDRVFDAYILIDLARSVNDLLFIALTDPLNFAPKSNTLTNASAAVDRLLQLAAKQIDEDESA